HRRVEVRRDDRRRLRKRRCHGAREDAGARGDLENPTRGLARQPRREIVRVGLEDQGNEVLLVELRDRAGEDLVVAGDFHGGQAPGRKAQGYARPPWRGFRGGISMGISLLRPSARIPWRNTRASWKRSEI